MGDMNAKVVESGEEEAFGLFGLGERNERGEMGKLVHRETTDGDEYMVQTTSTTSMDMEITWRQSKKSNRLCDN